MDTTVTTEIPFVKTEVKGADGKSLGFTQSWTNDTGKPVEVNPPGLVVQPGGGLFIDLNGAVALIDPKDPAPASPPVSPAPPSPTELADAKVKQPAKK